MKVEVALGRNRAKWLVGLKAGPFDPQGPRFFSFVRDEQWKRLLGIIDLAPGIRVSPLWTGEERRMFLMGLKPGNIKVCLCSQLDISVNEKWEMLNVTNDTMPPKRFRLCEPSKPWAGYSPIARVRVFYAVSSQISWEHIIPPCSGQ